MTGSYHSWDPRPKSTRRPDPNAGLPFLTSHQAAVADALSEQDKERIHREAVDAAREALAAFEKRRGRP